MRATRRLRGWLDWRVVVTVLAVLAALYLLAFVAQRVLSPGVARAATITAKSNGPIKGMHKGHTVVGHAVAPPKGVAYKSAYDRCWTWSTWRSEGNFFGWQIKGNMWQTACAHVYGPRTGKFYYWNATGYQGYVSSYGQALNWHYDGLYWYSGPNIIAPSGCFGCLSTKRVLQWSTCLPIPTGCIPNGTRRIGLWIKAAPDGTAQMGWWDAN